MIKRKHAVEIQVQGTIITISGFKDFVTGAVCDVKLLLEKISNSVSDKEILKTVQWLQHDKVSSSTTPYSPDATVFIENAFRMKLKKVDVLLDNQPHIINFEKMQEYNIVSGKSVKISRKSLELGDLNEDLPGKVSFINILKHATYPVIERTLYHGTSESSVKEICVHGFNRSFCGKNGGVYFAVNSALSVQDQYSPPNADGYKFIFVSKVLTGDYTKGCHSMKTAPLKETGDIPLRYDSVTDNITKPSMFVIFNDTQAFPEYLITCQRIHR
uniref:Poly [ADP-ribose] polymerase n=1 Tax=Amphilophus citrinellus TaxID=61819 RepID=A0A3Q0RCC6_AMPCI